MQPERKEFLPNGYRPQAFYGLKNYAAAHYYTTWIFLTPKVQATKYYSDLDLNKLVFDDLDQLISICAKKSIDLRLYINPAHAYLDGEGIRAVGKLELFEGWKRQISEIAALHRVPLWDFSGYNSVTTEKVISPMTYYWDSSHFTEKVGNWILSRVFGQHDGVPEDFGVLITPENIESHLQLIRANREKYINANKLEVRDLLADYKSIIGGAPLDQSRLIDMYQSTTAIGVVE
jgi:hypothetical protein